MTAVTSVNCFSLVICVFTGRSLPSNALCTKYYSFPFFRQVELNPCENGCVKAEVNHQEHAVIKSMECLNLETNEGAGDIYVEDHVGKNLAGKCMHSVLSRMIIGVN